jgi:hypothetical protein
MQPIVKKVHQMNNFEPYDHDDADEQTYLEIRQSATHEITTYSVEMFEYYTETMGKNAALGLCIEALSETLGNMISLVKDDNQADVLNTANLVIQQGLICQQEIIAEMVYGQVGHS